MKLEFAKEVEFEGKKYKSLDLDFESLTGRDIIDAEREAAGIAGRPVVDIDKTYQVCLAAKAAGVPSDMILSLPAKEFVKATSPAQDFLLGI